MGEIVQTLSFTRGRLPHWMVAGHAYFVTLCRKGCLPARVVAELRAERAERSAALRASGTSARTPVARDVPDRATNARLPNDTISAVRGRPAVRCPDCAAAEALASQRRRFLQLKATLDAAGHGERDLCDSAVSSILLTNLDWLRGCGWRVWAATLMPSHAHVVLSNTEGRGGELTGDLSRFMAYTARRINKARSGSGGFWQREPFDHWCRDGDAWLRCVSYTVNNPVKAGLCAAWHDWPHTVADPEIEAVLP